MSVLHVCAPHNPKWLPRVRRPGHKRYELVGKPRGTMDQACRALAAKMATGIYKRGDVLMIEPESYYGPTVAMTMERGW